MAFHSWLKFLDKDKNWRSLFYVRDEVGHSILDHWVCPSFFWSCSPLLSWLHLFWRELFWLLCGGSLVSDRRLICALDSVSLCIFVVWEYIFVSICGGWESLPYKTDVLVKLNFLFVESELIWMLLIGWGFECPQLSSESLNWPADITLATAFGILLKSIHQVNQLVKFRSSSNLQIWLTMSC